MFCFNCGTENPDSEKSCLKCGKEILAAPPIGSTQASSFQWLEYLFSAKGRVNRKLYWAFIGLYLGAIILALLIEEMLGYGPDEGGGLAGLTVLALVWPGIVIIIKRWHDHNRSGWWYLIAFVPVLGAIYATVKLGFMRGTVGPNQYGPDPLLASSEQPDNSEALQP